MEPANGRVQRVFEAAQAEGARLPGGLCFPPLSPDPIPVRVVSRTHVCLPGACFTFCLPGIRFSSSLPGRCFSSSLPGPSPSRRRPPAYRAPPAGPAACRNRTRQTCAQQPRVAPLLRSKPATLPTATRVLPRTAWTIPTVPCPSCQTASRRYAHSRRVQTKQLPCPLQFLDFTALPPQPRSGCRHLDPGNEPQTCQHSPEKPRRGGRHRKRGGRHPPVRLLAEPHLLQQPETLSSRRAAVREVPADRETGECEMGTVPRSVAAHGRSACRAQRLGGQRSETTAPAGRKWRGPRRTNVLLRIGLRSNILREQCRRTCGCSPTKPASLWWNSSGSHWNTPLGRQDPPRPQCRAPGGGSDHPDPQCRAPGGWFRPPRSSMQSARGVVPTTPILNAERQGGGSDHPDPQCGAPGGWFRPRQVVRRTGWP